MKYPANSVDGLTLVELMVAMVLSLVLMAAVYMAYEIQHKTSAEQDVVAAMQQDMRASMSMISRDIKTAGCNPLQADLDNLGIVYSTAGVTLTDSNSLCLAMDINDSGNSGVPDGKIESQNEFVRYYVEDNALVREDLRVAKSKSIVARDVVAFNVTIDAPAATSPFNTFTIVNVSLTMQKTRPDLTIVRRQLARSIRMRNA